MSKTQEPKLKPCPFCGGGADYIPHWRGGPMRYSVFCRTCPACMNLNATSLSDARAAWNKRAESQG